MYIQRIRQNTCTVFFIYTYATSSSTLLDCAPWSPQGTTTAYTTLSLYKTPHARHMYIQRIRQNTCTAFFTYTYATSSSTLLDCAPWSLWPVQRHHSVSILATTAWLAVSTQDSCKLSLRFHKPYTRQLSLDKPYKPYTIHLKRRPTRQLYTQAQGRHTFQRRAALQPHTFHE